MSFSIISFEKESISRFQVKTLDLDSYKTEDINFELYLPNYKIKEIKVLYEDFSRDNSYISQITSVSWEIEEFFDYGETLFVSFHHASDPTIFEVIGEVFNILKFNNL